MKRTLDHLKASPANFTLSAIKGMRTALLALLPVACVPMMNASAPNLCNPKGYESTSKRNTGRLERKVLDGDDGVGTVIHIRQLHGGSIQGYEEKGAEVATYQRKILEDLIADEPQAILPETLHYSESGKESALGCILGESGENLDCYLNELEKSVTEAEAAMFKRVNEAGTADDLTKHDGKLLDHFLYENGSAAAYIMIYPDRDVDLLMSDSIDSINSHMMSISISRDRHQRIEELLRRSNGEVTKKIQETRVELAYWKDKARAYNDRREREVTKSVMDYLETHPSARVHMIYGMAHNFCDDFGSMRRQPNYHEVHYSSPMVDKYVKDEVKCFWSPVNEDLLNFDK